MEEIKGFFHIKQIHITKEFSVINSQISMKGKYKKTKIPSKISRLKI